MKKCEPSPFLLKHYSPLLHNVVFNYFQSCRKKSNNLSTISLNRKKPHIPGVSIFTLKGRFKDVEVSRAHSADNNLGLELILFLLDS